MNNSHEQNKKNPGFRLHNFQVLNWGTFDKKIWSVTPDGENSLLTGDIGTGKSTLVDALTTLLVPAGRIIYNKAAGAEGRERSLADYILGQYKKEKDDDGQQAKAISLRKKETALTIILGIFKDDNFSETVSLAQFFWIKEGKSQVERFFLISSSPLSIEKDLSTSGADILTMKKNLKSRDDIEIFDTYTSYSAEFRRRMAIQSSQAIELFYQTVSMKSIGNLTDFVRTHMLEDTPVSDRIDTLCRNFENLNRAHEAVIRSRQQIEHLSPLIDECAAYDACEEKTNQWRSAREGIYSYMASLEIELCETRLERLKTEIKKLDSRLQKNEQKIKESESVAEKIRQDINDNGGRRLDELDSLNNELGDELKRRKERKEYYKKLAEQIDISPPDNEEAFFDNLTEIQKIITRSEAQQQQIKKDETELEIALRKHQEDYNTIEKELISLRKRPTNIPSANLEIRKNLCEALDIPEKEIPFAGELIEVREDETEWEGAIERLMHNFGLSLLVADENYDAVSEYVNNTNLRGRIVYYRVREKKKDSLLNAEANHVINKLRIKPDTPFFLWLETEIQKRFDYICCNTLEEFRHQPRALTTAGQIKSGGIKHEKDDRYLIHDRTRFILGWKNEQKISLLEKELKKIRAAGDGITADLNTISQKLNRITAIRDSARDLAGLIEFREIDWQSISLKLEEVNREIQEIRQSADILNTLKEQLDRIEADLSFLRKERDNLADKRGGEKKDSETFKERLEKAESVFKTIDEETRTQIFPAIEGIKTEILNNKKLTFNNIEEYQKKIREKIQRNIDTLNEQNKKRHSSIITMMQSFIDRYPTQTTEIDAAIESAQEFKMLLDELVSQDLPRHEERFKRLLREGTIQDIALFQNHLEKEAHEIREKIAIINSSLKEIEYNRGSYISLMPDRSIDAEIRHFQEDLKSCLGETLGNETDDIYTEHKFHQVKELIDRFRGREGFTEIDHRWTVKVTDVRNWFIFSASERWFDDDTEKEFYSDSSGKSGGQKEKLAYTILAAALAYQFSLVKEGLWKRSFRFVMIDEAFGRGSDESARYGLELFNKLQLQLLIVTPLQKIHVIEDFVKTVHFVYQENNQSLIGRMTVEEFKEKKQQKADKENRSDS